MGFVTRLAAAVAGTRVAAATGRYGIIGTAAGLLVTSAVLRWPGKALLVGIVYGVGRLWATPDQPAGLLEDHSTSQQEKLAKRRPENTL